MNKSLVQRIYNISTHNPNTIAQLVKNSKNEFQAVSYKLLMTQVIKIATFLKHQCKLSATQHVALICDNRAEWVVADLAILSLKAVDIPRGTETKIDEVAFIIEHSDSVGGFFEKAETYLELLAKHNKIAKKLKFVIILETTTTSLKAFPSKTFFYHDIINRQLNINERKEIVAHIKNTSPKDRATIIYTSGTTAQPKGVCLTLEAFDVQIDCIVPNYIPIKTGDVFLSILPLWHAYARAVHYIVLGIGATIAYSQPQGAILLKDILATKTKYMVSVPRIWEGIYKAIHNKIRKSSVVKKTMFNFAVVIGKAHEKLKNRMKGTLPCYTQRSKFLDMTSIIPYYLLYPLRMLLDTLVFKKLRALLGDSFIAGISGGGALAPNLDKFFAAANIKVLEGYGLTETAPILCVRNELLPEVNSVGKLFSHMKYKILDHNNNICPPGVPGVLYVQGPQVMQGYYKNEVATNAVLDANGWLNTGDWTMISYDGCLKILGREKDTIVLLSGENVEPEYVENIVKESRFISQIMLVGQDKKFIGALIVPEKEDLLEYAKQHNLSQHISELCNNLDIQKLYKQEISQFSHKLQSFEHIQRFRLIPKEFKIGEELTQTIKIKRNFVAEKYKKEIARLYN